MKYLVPMLKSEVLHEKSYLFLHSLVLWQKQKMEQLVEVCKCYIKYSNLILDLNRSVLRR